MKKLLAAGLMILGSQTLLRAEDKLPYVTHPDSTQWAPLFAADLSDAEFPAGVWTVANGELTASKDEAVWTKKDYENFALDLEFKTEPGSNSGVLLYCSNVKDWIPNALEIQIADDFAEKWAKADPSWHCGAAFGHLAPTESAVKKPGEWNRYTITCRGPYVDVVLNGKHVLSMDMKRWTSAKENPDGTKIPPWLSRPLAELPTKGKIGLQGKHAGVPIWFRNVRIREL
jgi:hypothetical protein